MGVYSNLDQRDIEQMVGQYDRGTLTHWSAIASGIENSNFLVELTAFDDQTKYILTLIEVADFRRSQEIVDLMTHLKFYGCTLPDVVTSRSNQRLLIFAIALSPYVRGCQAATSLTQPSPTVINSVEHWHNFTRSQVLFGLRPINPTMPSGSLLPSTAMRLSGRRMKGKRCIMHSRCTTTYSALTCRLDGPTGMPLGITFCFYRTALSAACSIIFTLARILSLWISQLPSTTGAEQWLAARTGNTPQRRCFKVTKRFVH